MSILACGDRTSPAHHPAEEAIVISIQASPRVYTVIVTVDADPPVLDELRAHAEGGLERFPLYEGFLGGALHRSTDGRRMVQYLQWESEGAYLACIRDPAWDDVPTTERFMAAVEEGLAQVDARGFIVVGVGRREGAG